MGMGMAVNGTLVTRLIVAVIMMTTILKQSQYVAHVKVLYLIASFLRVMIRQCKNDLIAT